MTDIEREAIISAVLARLMKPVLVVIQAATGYQREISARLVAEAGDRLQLAITPEALGHHQHNPLLPLDRALDQEALRDPESVAKYSALWLPFLDLASASRLASGCQSCAAESAIHHALMMGKPVLALRYHCDLGSEINQLRGLSRNPGYQRHVEGVLAQLAGQGVRFCTLDQMLGPQNERAERLSSPGVSSAEKRFITLSEIQCDPQLASTASGRLTDAAADYLKARHT